MRDFRTIRKFEIEWKNAKREIESAKARLGNAIPTSPQGIGGGGINLEELVDQLAEGS